MKSINFPVAKILPQLDNSLQFFGENRLNDRHYKELTETRGLPTPWVQANFRSVEIPEASRLLGYTAKSAGIWIEGHGLQAQFKPDKPWKGEDDKKAPKYRSPRGDYDAFLPEDPTDPTYWSDIEKLRERCYKIDGHPCIGLTEGPIKAIAACAAGVPTIAVLGVEMGLTSKGHDPEEKRFLVDTLRKYAELGFGFVPFFDADAATNPKVLSAELKLGKQLQKFDVPVHSCTGTWDVSQGKGIDDYIQMNGADKFKMEVLAKAQTLKALEKQLQDTSDEKTDKAPPADKIAREIAEQYGQTLAFNNEVSQWMRYGADNEGQWSIESDEYIESIVSGIIDGKGITGYHSHSYITNIIKKMRCLLIRRKWLEASPKLYLPFRNGILEIATGKLLPHAPSYLFTWQMPREHDPLATDWNTIEAFLDHATGGNQQLKNTLVCFCNAVLKGRSDLQKFLHLIGRGGSGKGTFMRLVTDLIGQDNTHSSTLEDWCSNRFESANAYGKRLVAFWDEDRKVGKLGPFKSLTGGDWLRGEEKGKKAFQFQFGGMVMVGSNFPPFAGDTSSGLSRRIIPIPFNATVAPGQRRNLNEDFQPELSAFTSYLLNIPDSEVTRTLSGLEPIAEVDSTFWEARQRTDSIAAWLNDWVIYDAIAQTPVGADKDEGEYGTPKTLYGSYALYCKQHGFSPKANKNFSPDLIELCQSILGWEVKRVHTKAGKLIQGLRPRTSNDDEILRYDHALELRVTGGDGCGDGCGDGSEPSHRKTLTEGDGSNLTSLEKSNSLLQGGEEIKISQKSSDLSVTTSKPLPEQASDPSPPPVTVPVTNKKAKAKPCLGQTPRPLTVKRKGRKINLPAAYPGLNGFNETKEPKQIARELCTIQSESEYDVLEKQYGEKQILWAFKWCLTYNQQDFVREVASGNQSQRNLFE